MWEKHSKNWILAFNGGWYFPINDFIDLELRGDLYLRGSWALQATTNYTFKGGNFSASVAGMIDSFDSIGFLLDSVSQYGENEDDERNYLLCQSSRFGRSSSIPSNLTKHVYEV